MNMFSSHAEANSGEPSPWKSALKHAITNGSVLMIFGSLLIGFVSDASQSVGIKHFTSDIFKGFLAIFLLDMGMVAATRFKSFKKQGSFLFFFALLMPLFNGCWVAVASQWVPRTRLIG
jgi:hypothetical protein